jgi:antitoxin PrlF
MALSRMTRKYQATIPRRIREALGVGAGDRVEFVITPDGVMLRRAPARGAGLGAIEASLVPEWNSPEDDEAFRGL